MKLIEDVLATMAKLREEHGQVDPARIVVNSVDDWRTVCLKAGLEPNAHEPEAGGLCSAFHGVPVIVSPLLAKPGEIVMLRGKGAAELAGSRARSLVLGTPRVFELAWEVVK